MTPTILQCGRRLAEIDGHTVRLMLRDNKRKPPRAVRQGTKTLVTRAECLFAGIQWVENGWIDFGDRSV